MFVLFETGGDPNPWPPFGNSLKKPLEKYETEEVKSTSRTASGASVRPAFEHQQMNH
jgi:hypothetical protein